MGKYLNEEKYLRVKKGLTVVSVIVLLIGIGMIIGAIITKSKLPDNWFEMTTEEKDTDFSCSSIMLVGGFLCFVSLIIFLISRGREISAYSTQQVLPIEKERIDEMSPTYAKAAKTVVDAINGEKQQIYCKHCGEQIDEDSIFCKSCGKQQ